MIDKLNLDNVANNLVNVGDKGINPVALSRDAWELIFKIACEEKGGVWKCVTKWFFFRRCNCTEKKEATTK